MVLFGGLWTRIPPIGSSRRLLKRKERATSCDNDQDRVDLFPPIDSTNTIAKKNNTNDKASEREAYRPPISYQQDSKKYDESERSKRQSSHQSQHHDGISNKNFTTECNESEGEALLPEGSMISSFPFVRTPSSFGETEQEIPSLTSEFVASEADMEVLKLCLFYTVIYMGISVIAFSFVFERWTIIDSLYFAVSTFTTCGYGNLSPTTAAGQIFTIFFAIYGVVILGVFIGIVGHSISQAQTRALRKLKKERQEEILETLFAEDKRDRKECDELIREGLLSDHASLMDNIKEVVLAELPAILLVAAAALVLGIREGWTLVSTIYFCIMSATTTGFGDYSPTTQIDKVYCIFFLPLAVAVFGEVLGRIAGVYIQRKVHRAEIKFLHRSVTRCDLGRMDANKDGMVDMEEFLTFMLVALQKVDRESIDDLKTIFRSLDKNGNGMIDQDDLVDLAERFDVDELVELAEQNPLLDDDEHRAEIETHALEMAEASNP
jgi:potassium channel subfamily K